MNRSFLALLVWPLLAMPSVGQSQFTYTTNTDDTLTITGYSGSGGIVTIPINIGGLTVTGIGSESFEHNTNIISVAIPGCVTSFGDDAFFECFSLTSVTVPGSVTNFGETVFGGCRNLTNVVISNGVTSIAGAIFDDCYSLVSVTIPDSVTNIEGNAFDSCGLVNFVIPASVTSVGEEAFYGCELMTNITIPESVTSLGMQAFYACYSLSNLVIPNSVTNIGYDAFDSCGFTNIGIPGSATNIGDYALSGCHNLINATVAKGVPMAYGLFSFCTNLTSVFFQGNAPPIVGDPQDGALFYDAPNVTVYYLAGTTGWSNNYQGVPAVLWNPQMQTRGASFGMANNQFGFQITGTSNIPIVLQACTNLSSPVWTTLTNVNLTNGVFNFSEPMQTNACGRYYRITAP